MMPWRVILCQIIILSNIRSNLFYLELSYYLINSFQITVIITGWRSVLKWIYHELTQFFTGWRSAVNLDIYSVVTDRQPEIYRVSQKKKRGPFLKLVFFLYFSKNLSKILYGGSKMILLCSGKILYIAVLKQEVTS